MSRARTIAPLEVHAGPTFVPRRITKHLGRGMERHAAGTAIYSSTVVSSKRSQPFLPSSPSEAPSCFYTAAVPLRALPSGYTNTRARQFARRLTSMGGLKRVVLAACHCVTPTCRSRCGPIRLSNTLLTIVTPSRTFVATWFKPLLAYTWLPAIDVAGT
jgi:hypothetical protein